MQKSLLTKTCQQNFYHANLYEFNMQSYNIIYYGHIKCQHMLYLQVMSAPSPLSSPSPGLPCNQKGICSHPTHKAHTP